jgi:hypothetical protein
MPGQSPWGDRLTNSLADLLENNSEVNQYFESLPSNVQDAVAGCGDQICSLEDLLRCVKDIMGTC